MVNVLENYKLIDLEIDGEQTTVQINTSDAWNVIKFTFGGKEYIANEGDNVEFIVNGGLIRKGNLLKLSGKGEKTKLKIQPVDSDAEEIWSVVSIVDDTFKVIKNQDDNENFEDFEDDESEDEE